MKLHDAVGGAGRTRHHHRIAVVLSAGGPVGHAFHAGVLCALERALGWDVRDADCLIGTSAGAQIAALVRAGLSGTELYARVRGEALSGEAGRIAAAFVRPCHRARDVKDPTPRSWTPASLAYLGRAAREPLSVRPGRLISALLPPGRASLGPQVEGFRRLFGEVWPTRDIWITAAGLDCGTRVAFGSRNSPEADMGTAVASSCAVPGLYAPVTWKGVRYVDGGVISPNHLDLLRQESFDLVLVSSPLSMFAAIRGLLRIEMRALTSACPVMTFEPSRETLRAMGNNPMALDRCPEVAKAACAMTLDRLRHGWGREALARVGLEARLEPNWQEYRWSD